MPRTGGEMLEEKDTEELWERMLRRHQKLPPAGTKRKIPEPTICPPLNSLVVSRKVRLQLLAEMCQATSTSAEECIRQAEEILAKQQGA
jgi:hypothetical protein